MKLHYFDSKETFSPFGVPQYGLMPRTRRNRPVNLEDLGEMGGEGEIGLKRKGKVDGGSAVS